MMLYVIQAHSSLRENYVQQFLEPMCPFILHVKDMQSDENYGYRDIADMLDFGEDG